LAPNMNKERCMSLIRSFTPTEDASEKRMINTTGSHVLFTASVAVSTLQITFKARYVMDRHIEIQDMNTVPNSDQTISILTVGSK